MNRFAEKDEDLLPRAFHVVGESPPEDGEPTNGEEYLRRVRWVARRTPDIVTSDVDPKSFEQKRTVILEAPKTPFTPDALKPKREWQEAFIADFSELRRNLGIQAKQLKNLNRPTTLNPPPVRDEKKWKELCYGPSPPKRKSKPEKEKEKDEGVSAPPPVDKGSTEKPTSNVGPLLSLLLPLDELSTNFLLSKHVTWLNKRPFSRSNTSWLFALLCRVEKPLDADLASDLRQLLRKCLEARAALVGEEKASTDRTLLPALNIIITIVELYFGQQDPED